MLPALPILLRPREDAKLLSDILIQRFRDRSRSRPIRILEAGCGRKWSLDLKDLPYEVVGIDNDKRALELRADNDHNLVETIRADLRNLELEPDRFDVIYCSYVLEHIAGAALVLDKFRQWLSPDGMILLKIPDRDSVYGFLARTTPFWLHVLYKRWIVKRPNAGKPGFDPFPTVYDLVVSRRGIHRYCQKRKLVLLREYGLNHYLQQMGYLESLGRATVTLFHILSFGRLAATHNNLVFVMEKVDPSASPT